MKVIIAGGRDFDDAQALTYTMMDLFWDHVGDCWRDDLEVVSGCAKGADTLGMEWAELSGNPVKKFPADWGTHGHAAGIYRNIEMGKYADVLVAFWDGKSKGTSHMIHEMLRLCKETHVYFYKGTDNADA